MSEVKVYRVSGKISKPNLRTEFSKEIRAVKPEDAVEQVYSLIGSKHRVRRFQMSITKVEEIGLDEVEDLIIRKLTEGAE